MKVLMVTNKVKTYALGFQTLLSVFLSLGHEVIWAADFSDYRGSRTEIPCKTIHIPITSNPFSVNNIIALKTVEDIIRNEKIEALQCSTPIGGLIGRVAGKQTDVSKIIYSAHGFLFYKGAPFINRTIYKWEEQWLAHYTDVLITINREDYEAGLLFNLRKGGKKYMIHGAGVEVGKVVQVNRIKKREELGIPQDAFVIASGGFLNHNKNNRVIIEAMGLLTDERVVYVACGDGEKLDYLKKLAKQIGVEKNVIFPGFRIDFDEILASSDVFVMPSFREGVPRSLLEAMDLGKACIGSRTRGISELIDEGEGGFLCNPNKPTEFAEAVRELIHNSKLLTKMGEHNRKKVKGYSKEIVYTENLAIYAEVL